VYIQLIQCYSVCQVSLANGMTFHPSALAGHINVTDRQIDRQRDRATVTIVIVVGISDVCSNVAFLL